jgi:CBS domain-containing protein
MVARVMSIGPDASVQEAARILLANRISAVLVIGENHDLLGLLSEGDLLRRVEMGTERLTSWRRADLTATARQILAEEFVKSHSRKVADVMTRDVITAERDTPLVEIARLMETNHVKRIPIVEDDKIVGIVSRANILQALVNLYDDASVETTDDTALHDRLVAELNAQPWFRTGSVKVTVHGGVVNLHGIVESAAEKNAVRAAAEISPGVRRVNDHLAVHTAASED